MKFLIDAQLPRRLANLFKEAGYEAIHTLDLPKRNATEDVEINQISIQEQYVVITKDRDFLNSFLTNEEPYKLLLVTTGNIKNNDLIALFQENLSELNQLLNEHDLIEINRNNIVVY
jgi:predicted nuclease of predicted toxin-antitoxin system